MKVYNVIPQDEIEVARWVASLPAKSVTAWTGRIYYAVAQLKAARASKVTPSLFLERLASLLADAASAGYVGIYDEMIRAEKELRPIVRKGGRIGDVVFRPCAGLRNTPKRHRAVLVIDAIDSIQRQHHRMPTRREIVDTINDERIGYGEVCRIVKSIGFDRYF